jgi:peptidoglycan hydrolase-like protein with peptidoglycan-binding domain
MFSLKRILSLGSISILLLSGLLFVAHAKLASAATASCTNVTVVNNKNGAESEIPSIGLNTSEFDCELGVGNQSAAVTWLQKTLNTCYSQGLNVDGDYGSATQQAVENVQAIVGVPVDGIYGPVTGNAMKWKTFLGGPTNLCSHVDVTL